MQVATCICTLLLAVVVRAVVPPVASSERAALVDFYRATTQTAWVVASGWSGYANASNDPCVSTWYGITCQYIINGTTSHIM